MKIPAALLRQHIHNTLLWTPGKGELKKSASGGLVKVTLTDDIHFLSTDGYVVVSAGHRPEQPIHPGFFVSGEDLKYAEKWLRGNNGGVIVVGESDNLNLITESYSDSFEILYQPEANPSFWEDIDKIQQEVFKTSLGYFAVNPRRLAKFALLEPRETYPVDFAPAKSFLGQQLLLWKHGTSTRGAVAPLDREILQETFAGAGVLWE